MSGDGKKRSPDELLRAVSSYAHDDDIAAVLAMSHEERKAELTKAGIDADDIERRGRVLAEGIAEDARARDAEAVPVPLPSQPNVMASRPPVAAVAAPVYDLHAEREKRRSAVPWLAAAAVLLLVGVGAAVLLGHDDKVAPREPAPPVPSVTPEREEPSPSRVAANELRDKAEVACAKKAWRECYDALQSAKAMDPQGDRSERVGAMRALATEGLTKEVEQNERKKGQ